MIIAVASGKGGTGKTTVAVNLAYALAQRGDNVRLLDCDVEEPNAHLFVRPQFAEQTYVTVPKPVWGAPSCTACGTCADACMYNAIAVIKGKVLIFAELCHSCGVCSTVCPEGALSERDATIGMVQVAPDHAPFSFAHGVLSIGEARAPNIVRAVKKHVDPDAVTIIDVSPGTSCPVVEALAGVDAVLLVTEPTPFGLSDLKLALRLTLKLALPTGIIVNRSDGEDRIIADYADAIGVPIAGRIPFRRDYAEAYSQGSILVEQFPALRNNLLSIYDHLATATPPVPAENAFEPASGEPAAFAVGTAEGYREITVISGKGGTGKTTVTACLAQLSEGAILADTDVDAADLHLLLRPSVREVHEFNGGTWAEIDTAVCIGCGTCADACRFNAITLGDSPNDDVESTYRVQPLACEGCGLCQIVCQVDAIRTRTNTTGCWYVSSTDIGPMVHARLGIAEENSGRLVTQVRCRAGELASDLKQELILSDGPPGTGCPVIASVSGTDLLVIVTEPTVSGVHDMERVMTLAAHFRVPPVVVINRADLNVFQAHRIEDIAAAHGSRVIGRIPFDRAVNDALVSGKTVIEYGRSGAEEAIRNVWECLQETLGTVP